MAFALCGTENDFILALEKKYERPLGSQRICHDSYSMASFGKKNDKFETETTQDGTWTL